MKKGRGPALVAESCSCLKYSSRRHVDISAITTLKKEREKKKQKKEWHLAQFAAKSSRLMDRAYIALKNANKSKRT